MQVNSVSDPSFLLYLHVPFCSHKCPYCDFNTYAVSAVPEQAYVSALLAELDYQATLPHWQGRTIRTIYFGGGTPSILSAKSIRRVIQASAGTFPIAADAEISLEANPGEVSAEQLEILRDAGVNRISFGAQSLNRKILKTLGRLHTPEQVEAVISHARGAGFTNVNLDLMYGVPDQTLGDLKADVHQYVQFAPEHISAYGLTIEKGTPFYVAFRKGLMELPDEDTLVEMMEAVSAILRQAGFVHYEISNFARPGREARHNSGYWNGSDYLGLGAGAHSYFGAATLGPEMGKRWSNLALPDKYIEAVVATGKAEAWQETLTPKAAMFEFFFLGLRKIAGVDTKLFKQRFNIEVSQAYPRVIPDLVEEKFLVRQGQNLALSPKGMLVADAVIENFSEPKL